MTSRLGILGAIFFTLINQTLLGQILSPPPSCAPQPEVFRILDENMAETRLNDIKFADRVAYLRQTLEDLITKYPTEVEPYRLLIRATKQDDIDNYPALVNRFQKQAEVHPQDALALYVAGLALSGWNTPLSIQFLEKARAQQKDSPWAAMELARIHAPGQKRSDPQKAGEEIAAFFSACPSSADPVAHKQLSNSGSKDLHAQVAAALRQRLATETNTNRLRDYAMLWSLEFRIHPPKDYPALRAQATADLHRLEALNPKPGIDWLLFLKEGYATAGVSPQAIAAIEDRIIQSAPHSDEAFRIVKDRWEKQHKSPDNGGDVAAWAQYHSEYRAALKSWMAQFTNSRELQHAETFYAALYDPDMPDEQGAKALNDYLTYLADYKQPSIGDYLTVAMVMVDHNWQPSRVFALLQNSDKLITQWHQRMITDNLSSETQGVLENNEIIQRQAVASDLLMAARLTEQRARATSLKPFVERELPPNFWPSMQSRYWLNRGRLAMLKGRKADALTFYQKALQMHKVPDAIEGRVIDDLADEARAVWKQSGGTDAAWTVWSSLPSDAVDKLTSQSWQKPSKQLPAFELTDLSGKTWRLKELNGQAVLINVWATWCGPCQRELPHLQKLYEQVKQRSDVRILTLNMDTDPSILDAFMKQKGFTFPVLPASTYVTGVLDMVAIPQNWIIGATGDWRWTGAPAGSEAQWESAMLKQLEAAR